MKKLILALLLLCLSMPVMADKYVRTAATGAANGNDWNNAWSLATINWSSIGAGNTLWIAGGSYSGSMNPSASGSAGNYIIIRRPLTTDGVPTAAAGWSSAFDSRVTITSSGDVVSISTSGRSYLYFDGRMDMGMRWIVGNAGSIKAGLYLHQPGNFITLTNIDILCAGGTLDGSTTGGTSSLNADHAAVRCDFSGASSDITISHCRLRNFSTLLSIANMTRLIVEYSELYDSSTSCGGACHGNIIYCQGMDDTVFRYNNIHDWESEGIYPALGHHGNWYIYGNVFHDGNSGSQPRAMEARSDTRIGGVYPTLSHGPFYVYNNVFYKLQWVMRHGDNNSAQDQPGGPSVFAPGSSFSNNIVLQLFGNDGLPSEVAHNYNYRDSTFTTSDANGVTGATTAAFVNAAGNDYHLVSTISATMPRNKGFALTAVAPQTFNLDPDGNTRGLDGTWDIGAYEYSSASQTNPPVIISALTATATNLVAFAYSIVASNVVTSYGASGLPTGLTVNTSSGVISGSPSATPGAFNVTITATNAAGYDSETLVITVNAAVALIAVTPTLLQFPEVATNSTYDMVFVVTNLSGTGTVSGHATNATAGYSIVGNPGYSITGTASTNITVRFTPTIVGDHPGTITFTGGGGATNILSGAGFPVFTGTNFFLTNALLYGFTTGTNYIVYTSETTLPGYTARAAFGFNLASVSDVVFTGNINAPDGGANSVYFQVDAEPTEPNEVWDITSFTTGFEDRTIGYRGSGTFDMPQYPIKTFRLAASFHKVVILSREVMQFKSVSLAATPADGGGVIASGTPTGLRLR